MPYQIYNIYGTQFLSLSYSIYCTGICFKNEQAMQLTTTMLNNIKQGVN